MLAWCRDRRWSACNPSTSSLSRRSHGCCFVIVAAYVAAILILQPWSSCVTSPKLRPPFGGFVEAHTDGTPTHVQLLHTHPRPHPRLKTRHKERHPKTDRPPHVPSLLEYYTQRAGFCSCGVALTPCCRRARPSSAAAAGVTAATPQRPKSGSTTNERTDERTNEGPSADIFFIFCIFFIFFYCTFGES